MMDFLVRDEADLRRNVAGIYEVCEWLVEKYPADIFKDTDNPCNRMRDLAIQILKLRNDI